ncbi:Peptidylprolyl isomerase [Aphelenchoides bicaudatus]|nr:Peptidylprolyl isomerase [Aphelenchoides bicaudatus]
MEVDDLLNGGRNAFSSGEVSLNGSINGLSADDEHALSDSELKKMQQSNGLANQIKSPSSTVLEKECMSKRLAADVKTEEKKEDDEWVDVLGSGDLLKKIITVGDGKRPENGDLVKISFVCLTEDSDEQTTQFVLGYGFNIDAFDIAIPLMNVGEKAHIKSHSRFVSSFDNEQTFEYEIELLEVQSADVLDLSYRIREAHEAANDYYNKRQYEKALRLYEYGIRLLTDADGMVEDIYLRRYTLISNSAACLIKLNEWEKVVELTDNLPF